jgi:hypothetical protein
MYGAYTIPGINHCCAGASKIGVVVNLKTAVFFHIIFVDC